MYVHTLRHAGRRKEHDRTTTPTTPPTHSWPTATAEIDFIVETLHQQQQRRVVQLRDDDDRKDAVDTVPDVVVRILVGNSSSRHAANNSPTTL